MDPRSGPIVAGMTNHAGMTRFVFYCQKATFLLFEPFCFTIFLFYLSGLLVILGTNRKGQSDENA